MKLARAIAENVGYALTVAVAVGATGLAITSRANGTSFWIGVCVAALGGLGAFATLIIALVRSIKTRVFRDALGRALMEGDQVMLRGCEEQEANAWAKETFALIRDGLGESEGRLFQSTHDLGLADSGSGPRERFMQRRMQRLSRLLDRAHALHVGIDFDAKRAAALFP